MDINVFIKSFVMSISTIFIFLKNLNYKPISNKNRLIIVAISVFLMLIDVFLKNNFSVYIVLLLNLFLQTVIFSRIVHMDLMDTLVGVMIANIISYLFFILGTILEYRIGILIKNTMIIVDVLISCIIQVILTFLLFKFRKFKNGLYILQKQKSNEYLNFIIISVCATLILIYCLLSSYFVSYNDDTGKLIYFSFLIVIFFMMIMIEKTLKIAYKHKLLEQTLKSYETQLEQKDKEIQKLSNEKYQISKLNHEFHNRQEALILKVETVLANMNYEIGEENYLKDKIQELSNEYTEKVNENKLESNLPKTGIEEIDDMFTYMKSECKKNGIEFILQINGNINYLINNLIDKNRLVTLIGDHLRDAIIAVNYSNNKYKSILAILGIKDDNYEFCIYDSGIEFEIETFEKLGIEPATTHKESGGTGIGFITTFETLNETKASMVIEELNELKENSYTKCIRFIFDNQNNLKIKSYRSRILKDGLKTKRFEIY